MEAWHAVAVMSAGMLKFLFAPIVSYQFGHSYLQTVLLTAAGGSMGAVFFFQGGRQILEWFRKRTIRRRARALAAGHKPKQIFTRTNRFVIKVKQRYGLGGLAFIFTPFLSVPVTALLAAKYFRHNPRTLSTLLTAVVIWSFVLSAVWKITG
ncbi:MAG TPA: hypothetical protein PKD45_01480 [Flavobacteriales bacterium]|nr:hypothetical protein [Flavobacteriales bacterium]